MTEDSVPLQLKRVLTAMRRDHSGPVPHRDFLHSLDRNCVRRKEKQTYKILNIDVVYLLTSDNVLQLIRSMMLMRCFSPS